MIHALLNKPKETMRSIMIAAGFLLALATQHTALAADESLKKIVILDFELIDETLDRAADASQAERIEKASAELRKQFAEKRFYQVVDNAPAQPLIDKLKSGQNLRECNGCEVDIGKALNADRVLTAWVQKVSNLILNINIAITDVSTGQVVTNKSVDIRSNTDDSWLRGIRYMVRSMEDKGQANR